MRHSNSFIPTQEGEGGEEPKNLHSSEADNFTTLHSLSQLKRRPRMFNVSDEESCL